MIQRPLTTRPFDVRSFSSPLVLGGPRGQYKGVLHSLSGICHQGGEFHLIVELSAVDGVV